MFLLMTAATDHSDPALDGLTELRDLGKMMGQVAGVPQLSPVLLLWGSDLGWRGMLAAVDRACMELRGAGPVSTPEQPPAHLFF